MSIERDFANSATGHHLSILGFHLWTASLSIETSYRLAASIYLESARIMSDIEIDVEAFGRRGAQLVKAIGVSIINLLLPSRSETGFRERQSEGR